MLHLKANTSVKVVIGPFVDVADGFTPETGITLGTADEAEIIKHDAAVVTDISANTWAAITSADGYYNLTLSATDTNTEGMLTVVIQDDSVCLPVKAQFMVMAEAAYDSMYVAGAGSKLTALASGTAQTGTSSTIQLAAAETFASDELNGNVVNIISGTGAGQSRVIIDYNGTTDTATVYPSWTTNPDITSGYEIVHGSVNITTVSNAAENLPTATDLAAVPTATENADALLKRDMSAVSGEAARSPLNALRFLRNKWSVSGTTLTVTKEDDSTSAWTATLTTDASANPVVGNDPV